ncbi:MAG: hypothetical protein ACI9FR_000628 [Cryomorphaceae bacterium]|jgi:hypothetical protein
MPKRINPNERQRLQLSSIVRRLPLHRQFNESQTALIKILPVWQKWAIDHLANEFQKSTKPSNYQATVLTITCEHAICASQVKHQRTTLLAFFHDAGLSNITQIDIRVVHPTQSPDDNLDQHIDPSLNSSSIKESKKTYDRHCLKDDTRVEDKEPSPVSHASIKSIENCHKRIPNEKLAESLSKLIATLKNTD